MPGVNLTIGGQSEQAQRAIQGVLSGLERLGGAGEFISHLGGKLTAALSVGAMVEFTRRAIEAADAIGKMAQKTGIAIQELSGLGAVAASDDVSLETLQLGLKGLSEYMVKTGQASRETLDVLLEQADLFSRLPDGAEKVAIAMQRFGRAGQEMIPFLNKGSEAIREQVKEATELGAVVGPAFAKDAERFNDNLHRVGLVFHGLFNNIAREVLPALNSLLEWFVEFAKRSDNFKPLIETIVTVFKVLASATAAVAGSFEAIGAFLGQFAGTLAETGDPFEAWSVGANAASQAMDRMDKVFEAINSKINEPTGGREANPLGEAATARIVEAQRELKKTQAAMAIEVANRSGTLDQSRANQIRLLAQERDEYYDLMAAAKDAFTQGTISLEEYNAACDEANQKVTALKKQIVDLMTDRSFGLQLQKNLRDLTDQWAMLGRNAADFLTNSVKTAVDGVTDSIMGAIEGTKTWGQVFLQVGRSIIASLIQVVVQWVAQMTIVRALQKIFHTEQQVQAAQRAATEAPGAALAATSSYGTAAIIGAVALAAILALALSFAAFAEGGLVKGGEQLIRVNERGQEFVMNAAAVDRFGENFFANLNAGHSLPAAAAASPAAGPTKNEQNVHVAVFDNPARMNEYLRSAEGSKVVLDLVQSNLHQIIGKA